MLDEAFNKHSQTAVKTAQ